MAIQLEFDCLYQAAISEWPQELTLTVADYSPKSGYLVPELEDIGDRWIGSPEEVIMREIHTSIFTVFHRIAANCTFVKRDSVRKEAVRYLFEERLKSDVLDDETSNWSPDDRRLVEKYFKLNPQSSNLPDYSRLWGRHKS